MFHEALPSLSHLSVPAIRESPYGTMTHNDEVTMKRDIQIVEVGPRDGLQNESVILSTDDKLALIDECKKTAA